MLALLVLAACGGNDLRVRNNEPVPTILAPRAAEALVGGYPATLLGTVTDTNHPAGSLVANWLSGEDVICADAPLASDGTTSCDITVDEADAAYTLQVVDPDGAEGLATVDVAVRPNAAPVVTITAPDGAGPYAADGYVVFEATVTDADEPAEGLALAWTDADGAPLALDTTVDGNGALTGALLLPAGTHTVTLTATDLPGAVGEASVTVEVVEE